MREMLELKAPKNNFGNKIWLSGVNELLLCFINLCPLTQLLFWFVVTFPYKMLLLHSFFLLELMISLTTQFHLLFPFLDSRLFSTGKYFI